MSHLWTMFYLAIVLVFGGFEYIMMEENKSHVILISIFVVYLFWLNTEIFDKELQKADLKKEQKHKIKQSAQKGSK